MLDAEGSSDNSAVRQNVRDTQKGNIIAQARMTMDLMKANGCKMPTSAPSGDRYGLAAIKCKTAQLEAESATLNTGKYVAPDERCDQAKWTPLF